jgi:hypothetical protein
MIQCCNIKALHLEAAVLEAIKAGHVTKHLAICTHGMTKVFI